MDLFFETDRLVLRPPEDADVTAFVPLISDLRVARNLGPSVPHPYTLADGYNWVTKMRAKRASGEDFSFGIIVKTTGEYIGCCSVYPERDFEFGYWIGVPYWQKGYATEAAKRVARFAFDVLHAAKLKAHYIHDNQASERVLTKLGFQHSHDRVSFSAVRGEDVLGHYLELTREPFE